MTCPIANRMREEWHAVGEAHPWMPNHMMAEYHAYKAHLAACMVCRAELDADATLPVKPHEADYDVEEEQP